MPVLTVRQPGREPRVIALVKPLTSVGLGADHDVALTDPGAADVVVAIENDRGRFHAAVVEGSSFVINGRRQIRHVLAEGDVLRLGETELTFSLAPQSEGAALRARAEASAREAGLDGAASSELQALAELHAFSERLMTTRDLDALLEALVDHAVRITRADKGFLVLVEGGELHVKVARGVDRQNIGNALERLSDSIVKKVLASRRPLIVSDALNDEEFNASASVVNLKLCSVMCVPLLERGGEPFGLIYLGNDRVANLFERRSLELLTVYAAQASLVVRNARLLNELSLENEALRRAAAEQRFGDIIGACEAMRDVYRKLDKIAPTDISVLITGETGTGKELIARELHRRSPRKGGPFIPINCGAIPENLLESELFGHVKGAFTGAVTNRIGRFQAANGGTLFLDEVGELPTSLQVKLLRALQEKTVTRVGETRSEAVDIRIVAATNRVLEEEIKSGRFREDLYYRLNVVGLHLPPLRERGDDIEVIARHLLVRYAREFDSKVQGFAPGALSAVRRYGWPGNIRQLENRLKKAVVLADGPLVTADDLDLRQEVFDAVAPLAQAVEEFKERYVDEVLLRNNGNRTKTARDLGVDARTVFRYLERKRARMEGRRPEEEPEGEDEPV